MTDLPEGKTILSAYVPTAHRDRLKELLADDETLSRAVAVAVEREVELRERALELGRRFATEEEGVSHET